jgi:hypothetical protein
LLFYQFHNHITSSFHDLARPRPHRAQTWVGISGNRHHLQHDQVLMIRRPAGQMRALACAPAPPLFVAASRLVYAPGISKQECPTPAQRRQRRQQQQQQRPRSLLSLLREWSQLERSCLLLIAASRYHSCHTPSRPHQHSVGALHHRGLRTINPMTLFVRTIRFFGESGSKMA